MEDSQKASPRKASEKTAAIKKLAVQSKGKKREFDESEVRRAPKGSSNGGQFTSKNEEVNALVESLARKARHLEPKAYQAHVRKIYKYNPKRKELPSWQHMHNAGIDKMSEELGSDHSHLKVELPKKRI